MEDSNVISLKALLETTIPMIADELRRTTDIAQKERADKLIDAHGKYLRMLKFMRGVE